MKELGLNEYFWIAYYLQGLLRHLHWSRDKIEEHQNLRLRAVVLYAYNHVPFYHRKFKALGVNPEALKTVQDLRKLPIVTRTELQRDPLSVLSDEFDARALKTVSTSGSSGLPLFTRLTAREDAFRKAKLLRANIICGQKPRDKWVVITAPQHESHTSSFQKLLSVYLPTPVSVFDSTTEQLLEIEKLKPDVLDGYSSSLLLLAKEMDKIGNRTIKPRLIIGGAELIEHDSRRFVEEVFEAPFYDEYACVELERLAWQCEERSGYHIDVDSVIMQFVDEDGEEVAPGETGGIVCTSLFNNAMPFIRYAVGDLGQSPTENTCPCGRNFPMMKVMEGRKDSILVLPDGRSMSPLAMGDCMSMFKYFANIFQYRVVQKRTDSLQILVKKKNGAVNDESMKADLFKHIRNSLKLKETDVTIDIEFVDEIPPDKTGKIRKIISEIGTS
jgi:phenylacetate-CoA ligase